MSAASHEYHMRMSKLEGSFIPVISPGSDNSSTAVSSIESWIQANHDKVVHHLASSGALLFRGFDVTSAQDFERVGLAVNPALATRYPGGAPRTKLAPHVWTASETPGHMPISSHCELSYIPNIRPTQILFCGLDVADEGGETPIANMHDVWQSLPKDLQDRIASTEFEVVRQYPGSKRRMLDVRRLAHPTTEWYNVLGSKDPIVVNSEAEKDGVRLTFWKSGEEPPLLSVLRDKCQFWGVMSRILLKFVSSLFGLIHMFCPWPLVEMQEKISKVEGEDTCVELVTSFPGYLEVSGQKAYAGVDVFFSEYGWMVEAVMVFLHTWRFIHAWVALRIVAGTVVFGVFRSLGLIGRAPLDLRMKGRSLSLPDVININRAYWKNFTFLKWQAGDVLVLNNELCSHGRMPYEGKRTVLTAFA